MTTDTRFNVRHRVTHITIILVVTFTLALSACEQMEDVKIGERLQDEPIQLKNREHPDPKLKRGREKVDEAELRQLAEHYVRMLGQANERYGMYVERARKFSAACGAVKGLNSQRLKERGFEGLVDEGRRTCEERVAKFDRATRRYARNLLKAAEEVQYLVRLARANGYSGRFKELGGQGAQDSVLFDQANGS